MPGIDNQDALAQTDPVTVDELGTLRQHLAAGGGDQRPHAQAAPGLGRGRRQRAKPEDANLIIRPGVNWDEGERYIVALRRLRDKRGGLLESQPAFRAYRDKLATTDKAFEGRRAHMEDVIGRLGQAGIKRDDLYLAWDFTVASEKSLSGRILSMRDDAFAKLGDTNLRT